MPLYEYQCDSCGHRFEAIQKFSDPPLEQCPTCGAPVRKLQSAPAFQFKGAGWYVTDYAKKGDAAPAKGSEGSAGETTSTATPGSGDATAAPSGGAAKASPESSSKPG